MSCVISLCEAQEWGPSYIPDVPKSMGSAIQEICPWVQGFSWKPSSPRVGQEIHFSVELLLDEELTDAEIQEARIHVTYPDGTEISKTLENKAGTWSCVVPGASSGGTLYARLEVLDTLRNRFMDIPVRDLSWPPVNEDLYVIASDWPEEDVLSTPVDLTELMLGLTDEFLICKLSSVGGIRVADSRWFLYGLAVDRKDYDKEDQGDELGSSRFFIYIPILFKALIIDPEKLFGLSVTEFLAGPGDGDALCQGDHLYLRISRERLDAHGEDPFKIIAMSLALDAGEGLDLSALSGGDATPYALIHPGLRPIEILE